MRRIQNSVLRLSVLDLLLALTFFVSGSAFAASYSIGGTVLGLGAGKSVTLLSNGTNALTRTTNGTFVFSTKIATGATYKVTVKTQPFGQKCTAANGSGVVGTANVSSVQVTCVNVYSVGGTVSGLGAGKSVTLVNKGTNSLTRSVNGSFKFTTRLAAGAGYSVTVGTQPIDQRCSVTNGAGTIGSANVTNVLVNCVNTYSIGGSITGLNLYRTVTLLNMGANSIKVSANGTFAFSARILSGGSYSVMVGMQPWGQACGISNGAGTNISANVTTVQIHCGAPKYQVTDIGTLGGAIYGRDINESGEIVGKWQLVDASPWETRAFLYSDGQLTDLGSGDASGINDLGQVVGTRVNEYGDERAYLYDHGQMTLLYDDSSKAIEINNSGWAGVMWVSTSSPSTSCFLTNASGERTDLSPYCDRLMDINEAGDAVGSSCSLTVYDNQCGWQGTPPKMAFVYASGSTRVLTFAGDWSASRATSINNVGQVTGTAQISGGTYLGDDPWEIDYIAASHAFRYSNGTMLDLGTLGGTESSGNGINDSGTVVGAAEIAGSNEARAFVYDDATGLVDLNSLIGRIDRAGTRLREATAINNAGMIVAIGANERTYLLIPVN